MTEAKPKRTKVAKDGWSNKVMSTIDCQKGKKMSLQSLKKALNEAYGIDMSITRNKTHLKSALLKCVESQQLEQIGGSYRPFGAKEISSRPCKNEENQEEYPPVDGIWGGLSVQKREKAKSARSTCKCCNEPIEKGTWRLNVVDGSLFQMCIAPGDHHEGVSRGYVECVPPDGKTVSRRSFFIHEECQAVAEEKFKREFHEQWAIIQPHFSTT